MDFQKLKSRFSPYFPQPDFTFFVNLTGRVLHRSNLPNAVCGQRSSGIVAYTTSPALRHTECSLRSSFASRNPSQSWGASHANTLLEQSAHSTHNAPRETNGEYKKNPDDHQDYHRMERHY